MTLVEGLKMIENTIRGILNEINETEDSKLFKDVVKQDFNRILVAVNMIRVLIQEEED